MVPLLLWTLAQIWIIPRGELHVLSARFVLEIVISQAAQLALRGRLCDHVQQVVVVVKHVCLEHLMERACGSEAVHEKILHCQRYIEQQHYFTGYGRRFCEQGVSERERERVKKGKVISN